MPRNTGKLYPFPSDLVSPEKKADKDKYGLPLARAIYHNNRLLGSSLFYNDSRLHKYYLDYALGKQDTNKYKPLLGVNSRNDKNSILPSIRWNIRNYATKRINVVVSKITNNEFDPIVEAIDPLAIDKKKDYKFRLQEYIKDKAWIDSIGQSINTDLTPFGLSPEQVPTNDEEIDIHLQTNVKLRSEIELEDGIALHLERNNYEQLRKQTVFDLFVLGLGCIWTGTDRDGHPVIKRIQPEDMIVPYSEQPDFSNINYAGSVQRMTVAEIKKLAGDQFSDKDYERIEEEFSTTTDREHDSYDYRDDSYVSDYGDVKKVKVVHFEYLTENELVHIEKKDRFGNTRFSKQPFDVYKTRAQQEKFKKKYGKERKLYRTPYTACYEGYWIVGSDFIFNYGLKQNTPRKRGAMGDAALGYKIFAPNMFSGQVISTVKQMIPVLDDLQEYHLKIQQVVSSAVPKGIEIDLFELSKVQLEGEGGKTMSPMELIELYFQRGVMVRNSNGEYAQGTGYKPISEMENGMAKDIVHYVSLITQAKEELDEITGVNRVMAGSNLHQETGKAVAQIQGQASEVAIDYIYDADEYIFNEMCKTLGVLHVQATKKNGKKYYLPSLGDSSIKMLADSGIDKHDFGYYIEPRPSKEEWQRFYQTADVALQQKEITLADHTFLYRIRSLKRAQQYLVYAEKKQKRYLQEKAQQEMAANQEMQMQSNQQAHQNAMMLEEAKMNAIRLQAEEERKTIQMKIMLESEAEMKLEQVRSGAKVEMNERNASSKEGIETMKSQTQEDIAVFNRLENDENYNRESLKDNK